VIEMPHHQPTPTHPFRVLIVDDDRRVRQSLSGLIALRDGVEVIGTAPDSQRCLELVRTFVPDAVLLDIRLPEEEDGLGLVAELHREWPSLRVVAMSVQTELGAAALAAGADAFVSKAALGRPEAICDALIESPRLDSASDPRRQTH
jgi:two-component system response regulator DesR